ncbi:four-carbon acid sugar kinase family protein [Streptomyces sp. AgN23]|uniref:four-carbon acid sugar kinase family protein n=1 Tax=Streptomyces TaxID=1883 RepID=UPI0032B76B83
MAAGSGFGEGDVRCSACLWHAARAWRGWEPRDRHQHAPGSRHPRSRPRWLRRDHRLHRREYRCHLRSSAPTRPYRTPAGREPDHAPAYRLYADDFTGGTDVAAAFRRAGLRTALVFGPRTTPPSRPPTAMPPWSR